MAAADYRLMTEATGQRIAAALEALSGFGAYLTTANVVNNLNSTTATDVLSAPQGKYLNEAKPNNYNADVSTLSDFYGLVQSMTGLGGALIFLRNTTLVSILTGGKLSVSLYGTIYLVNASAGTYEFDVRRANNGNRYAWRITGLTSADATITVGTVYEYTGTAI